MLPVNLPQLDISLFGHSHFVSTYCHIIERSMKLFFVLFFHAAGRLLSERARAYARTYVMKITKMFLWVLESTLVISQVVKVVNIEHIIGCKGGKFYRKWQRCSTLGILQVVKVFNTGYIKGGQGGQDWTYYRS